MNREVWKNIPGWEGLYQASNRGRIRGVDRVSYSEDGQQRRIRGRVLKTPVGVRGYPRCNLHRHGKKTHVNVHILVAGAFHGKCPRGQEVRHVDGKKVNCRSGNLCYGTTKQNAEDRVRHGTINRCELNGVAKLTKRKASAIRRIYAAGGISQEKLGKRYGVVQSTIGCIVRGERWKP